MHFKDHLKQFAVGMRNDIEIVIVLSVDLLDALLILRSPGNRGTDVRIRILLVSSNCL
jgi:hypothetical protein